MFYNYFESPIGIIELKYESTSFLSIRFLNNNEDQKLITEDTSPLASHAIAQLKAYFNGELKVFDLPLKLAGTNFQQKVWTELKRIEYGKTKSYLQLAKELGDKIASAQPHLLMAKTLL